jgi:hypothetical protein
MKNTSIKERIISFRLEIANFSQLKASSPQAIKIFNTNEGIKISPTHHTFLQVKPNTTPIKLHKGIVTGYLPSPNK